MKTQLKSEILNSIENDKTSKIHDVDTLVSVSIEKIKKLDKHNVINFSDYDLKDMVNLAINYRKRQLEKVISAENFDINNINYSKSIDSLINQHTKYPDRFSTDTLLIIYRLVEVEDENKRLTLTGEQYNTWLVTSDLSQYITTKQFQILYGLSSSQQKGLRQKLNDPLPHLKLNENSNILYNRFEVEKWLENYSGKMKI